ncbi:MAG TPA: hypothetical protein VKU19_14920 [Bryobacteraceae bacterium]|nr:hypothetical protein [Bryobacteraceae bacterium]
MKNLDNWARLAAAAADARDWARRLSLNAAIDSSTRESAGRVAEALMRALKSPQGQSGGSEPRRNAEALKPRYQALFRRGFSTHPEGSP